MYRNALAEKSVIEISKYNPSGVKNSSLIKFLGTFGASELDKTGIFTPPRDDILISQFPTPQLYYIGSCS